MYDSIMTQRLILKALSIGLHITCGIDFNFFVGIQMNKLINHHKNYWVIPHVKTIKMKVEM